MLRAVLFTSAILLSSCQEKSNPAYSTAPHQAPVTEEAQQNEITSSEYKEVWIMRGWQGYMCVIIALKENEYDAWFSSCTRGEDALTPLKGHYSRTTISNHFSKDRELLNLLPSEPELSFYSLQWETQFEEGTAYLASPDDLENNRGSDRWLRSVDPALFSTYLADSPFTLHMNPQLESEQ